jgi:hypothetical protein
MDEEKIPRPGAKMRHCPKKKNDRFQHSGNGQIQIGRGF